jgi:hypothetical protein
MAPGMLIETPLQTFVAGSHQPAPEKRLLPPRFPRQLRGPMVWTGQTLNEQEYTYELSAMEVQELEQAMQHFYSCSYHLISRLLLIASGLELDGEFINVENFPLPNLGPNLRACAKSVHNAVGFAVLKGLDSRNYTAEENALLFLGISSYIGNRRGRQDIQGSMISENSLLEKQANS